MPTYEYLCDHCGYNFETRQSFKDAALTLCPNCNQETLHRVPQAAGVVFKGSGWYITDSKGKQNLVTPGEKKADGTSEAAPAASTESSNGSSTSEKSEKSTEKAATPAPSSSTKTEAAAT